MRCDVIPVLFCFMESGAFPAGHEPPDDWWTGLDPKYLEKEEEEDPDQLEVYVPCVCQGGHPTPRRP